MIEGMCFALHVPWHARQQCHIWCLFVLSCLQGTIKGCRRQKTEKALHAQYNLLMVDLFACSHQ